MECNLSRNTGFGNARENTPGKTVMGTRRMQITIETDEVTIIRRRHALQVWCPECAHQVEAVQIDEAGVLARTSQLTLREYAESRRWHLLHTGDGTRLICLASLLKTR
jgi:hypothetical protein